MSNKSIVAKRLALALVAALGFGVVQTAPSGAAVTAASTILTLSASSTTAVQGETTTAVTVTVQFQSSVGTAADSVTVSVASPSGAASNSATSGNVFILSTDSSNATVARSASDSAVVVITPTLANGVSRAVFTYRVRSVTSGTWGYTLNAHAGSSSGTLLDSKLYTVTVSAADESASATKSNLFINKVLPSGTTYYRTDSALIVSAGQQPDLSLMTPTRVAYAMGEFRNAAGDSINATTGTAVSGTMVVKITSGPGFLSRYETATATQLVRQISITLGDSIVIWNDGSAGVGTITTYIGTTPLTDPADTITFFGKAEKFVATANAVTAAGYNLSTGSDSVTSGANIITFVATDAAGIKVPSASQNRNQVFYVHSSDTTVVRGLASATLGYGTCNAPATTADETAGKWDCDMYVIDSGTVTLTVSDSSTLASSLYKSNEISVTVAGAAYKGTVSFAKYAVQAGENVLMTMTCVDRAGRACGQTSLTAVGYSTLFNTGGTQTKQFIGGTNISSTLPPVGTATFTTIYDWATAGTFMGGTDTNMVTMPLTAGDVVITITTGGVDRLPVEIPTLVVTNADVTAATASADAATDAAAEAIDAANAATDAANLAAEAADAATVAAEEARDAADAATAAVEELATQVATLMAALQAQIKTLANTVAKIAKKVKA